MLKRLLFLLTAKGSACSQEIGAPQDAGLTRSGRDSGTATKINSRSEAATKVASATTALSSYILPRYPPSAGLMIRLAANVAETWGKNRRILQFTITNGFTTH